MDNFMDKIAKKLAAQDIIRANATAETEEFERMQNRVAEYDACIQEIRKVNLRNSQTEERLKEAIHLLETQNKEAVDKIAKSYEEKVAQLQMPETQTTAVDELAKTIENMNVLMNDNMQRMEELFKSANDFAHKENVKVYRNVQAVVVEEVHNQTKELLDNQKIAEQKSKLIFGLLVVTLIGALASAALTIVNVLGII